MLRSEYFKIFRKARVLIKVELFMTIHSVGALMRDACTYTKHSDHGSSETRLKRTSLSLYQSNRDHNKEHSDSRSSQLYVHCAGIGLLYKGPYYQDEMLHANADIK